MKLTVSRRALFISTAVLSLSVAVSGLPAIALAADGTIKLGLVAPMSGPNARYGAFSMHGAELAVKDINDAGGIDGMKSNFSTPTARARRSKASRPPVV